MSQGVYNYEGSLTTPSCNEVVQWVVCKAVQPMSAAQKTIFDSMGQPDGSGGFVISNRIIQTNANTLYSISSSYLVNEAAEESDRLWMAIVFPILGALIIIALVIVIVCCVKKGKCKKKRVHSKIISEKQDRDHT